jgi:hypothetical protein
MEIAAGILLILGVVAFRLVRRQRRLRREEATRREILRTLGERFGLRATNSGLEGAIGARQVTVTFQTEYLLMARITLTKPALPPAVRVVEFADGPHQKTQEFYAGAHETGDRSFDSKFLVYGTAEHAQGLPSALRQLLLEHPLEDLQLTRQEVARPLAFAAKEAVSDLEQALALCDLLEDDRFPGRFLALSVPPSGGQTR